MQTTKKVLCLLILAAFPTFLFAQSAPKPLDHDAYDIWNRINEEAISNNGDWILYSMSPEYGDALLNIKNIHSDQLISIPRGVSARFTADSRHVVAHIKPPLDSLRQAKLEKVKNEDMPGDSLVIVELNTGIITTIGGIKSYQTPKNAGGLVAYHLKKKEDDEEVGALDEQENPEEQNAKEEQSNEESKKRKDKEEGTSLILRDLATDETWTFNAVTAFAFSEDGSLMAYTASSNDGSEDGVFAVNTNTGAVASVMTGEGIYKNLTFDKAGTQLAFLTNSADYASEQPSFALYHWVPGKENADLLAEESSEGIPEGWWVSEHGEVSFSESGNRLLFGTAPRLAEEKEDDIPDDEEVELDIWHWQDPLLQPMQLVQLENEKKRSYLAIVHLEDRHIVQLADELIPAVTIGSKGDADVAVGNTTIPYRMLISWESPAFYDIYVVDVNTGNQRLMQRRIQSPAVLSPQANYITWWNRDEGSWYAQATSGGEAINLTSEIPYPVYDEIHDRPFKANPYGSAGWTEEDQAFLIYDRHDIWSLDPSGSSKPVNMTNEYGRNNDLRFRHITLDPDQTDLDPDAPLLLSAFHYTTKRAGFYRDQINSSKTPEQLLMEDARFSYPDKAKDTNTLLFTRESFQEFPDLQTSDLNFAGLKKQSQANPQQADYLWGSAELVEWTSLDGIPLQGMLFKPENFDPNQKYPMMVYFYEKMSNTFHNHRPPATARSSISFSFYTSRGYLVFVPDIPYKEGYPGESALNAVVPGVTHLIATNYVDEDNIGVQGHSWGGYQIAYMVTETNLFKAAEAGAPVVNMTSAYGGIRWASGLSRMFQYEDTQSRIGGSLWEYPLRYLDNSPLFQADKIETPILMMHNDADGAVPWYQGIEFFVALRRLGKPAWLLNYNGEAHGLREYHNKRDWAIRMQQFFDHYLKGAPAPVWMAEGVPAIEKGKTLGLELVAPEPVPAAAPEE